MYGFIYLELLALSLLLLPIVLLMEIPCDQLYSATTKDNLWCYPCSAGYLKISDCIYNGEQARCQPCRRGEYMPSCDNSTKCAICGSCSSRQVIVNNCSTTGDIECQCKNGYYWQPYASYCKTYSKCGKGSGLAANGTPFEDTICVPCVTGVSYSETESFNACSPCSECNSTSSVITECSATHDVVCGIPIQQPPKQKLDDGILASIIASVVAVVISVTVVAIACNWYRKFRYACENNTESNTVELPSLNIGTEDHPINTNSITQNNPEVNSVTVLDENFTRNQSVTEPESDSCSDNESDTERTATDCNWIDNNPVNSNVCHHNNENDLQNDASAIETNANNDDNEDYNKRTDSHVQKGDLKEEIDIEYAQNEKMNDIPMSDDASILVTPHENENNNTLGTSIEPFNCRTEQEPASDLESSYISLDVVDVSPRGSVQSQELCRNSGETILTDEITPGDQTTEAIEMVKGNEVNKEQQEVRSVKGFQSDCKVWVEAISFLACSLKWVEFNHFVRILVAKTNEELLGTIDVVIDHAKVEENNNCRSMINHVMAKWRQATPKATVNDVVQALKESQLNLASEQLAEKLSQKLPRSKVQTPSCSGLHNEICKIQSRDIDHVIENLKELEVEEFD